MTRTILGRKRHGKTTLLIKMLRERQRPALVISFDKEMVKQFNPRHRFTSARRLLDHVIEAGGIFITTPLCISIMGSPEEVEREFNLICKLAIAHRNVLVMVDEIDMFDSASSQDVEFYKMIHFQAHEFGGELDLVTASRKPSRISRDLRGQTDEFYLFKMTDSRDLNYISEDVSADLPETVKHLPKYSYLKFDVAEEEISKHETCKY
jgi:hypothetical protein